MLVPQAMCLLQNTPTIEKPFKMEIDGESRCDSIDGHRLYHQP